MSFTAKLTGLLNAQATATALGVASRTGLLDALSPEAQSASALASAAGLSERYVREILAVLVCGDVVSLVGGEDCPGAYVLPQDSQEALSQMGLYFEELPLLSQCAFQEVCEAATTGGGVPSSRYAPFGSWMGKLSDEKHERQLVQTFLPALEEGAVVARLSAGARVLDLGCGHGVAARLIARAFPRSNVVGVDIDAAAIAAAKAHPEAGKLGGNLEYIVADASRLPTQATAAAAGPSVAGDPAQWPGSFDLVLSFDAIHDLSDPTGAMTAARSLLAPDGVFAMVDIRARSCLSHNRSHSMAPFLYTVSLLHCMPQGLNHGGPGLGMMWGREKAVAMLREAGFGQVEVVELQFDTFNDVYLCRVPDAAGP
eukprot:jgi/Tetstr1/442822/TSEL_030905.t1